MQQQRKKHIYSMLQPVTTEVNGAFINGIIISKLHKLPKNGSVQKEEPYYIITGHGPAIWENHLTPITEEEYKIACAKEGK